MTHDDIILALGHVYPDSEWSYDGDGSSLDPIYDGETLISRGLEWHDESQPAPTLAVLEAALPAAQTAASLATGSDHAAVSAQIVSEQLASVPVPRDQLAPILQTLLGDAAAAIPFFERYALDPSETSEQWTAFQALDQQTKDRLLYDALRTLTALMRYLTGNLPATP